VEHDADVPAATLTAAVALPALVALGQDGAAATAGTGGGPATGADPVSPVPSRSLALGGPAATPSPGLLRDRSAPVVLRPHVASVTWRLALPDGWCPAQSDSSGVDNATGSFHQSLTCAGGRLTVDRRTELRQRWVDPAQLPALAELSLAEHRAAARRLRLDRLHG
jgi:hypothetical protein